MLVENVEAETYTVYVPTREIGLFRGISGPRFQVLAQEALSAEYAGPLAIATSVSANPSRYGWYLQQFHKIKAVLMSSAERVVIWDADCVPVRKIQLWDEAGNPLYMKAKENHSPYFESIWRLLNLRKITDFSFVIPGFPILSDWAHSFVDSIEAIHTPMKWHEAVIESIDFDLKSGFSETETLGTWISHVRSGDFSLQDIRWERYGQSKFGLARRQSLRRLRAIGAKLNLDIVSFENWDLPAAAPLLVQSVYRIVREISRIFGLDNRPTNP
jgi:hypothetical protein